MNIANYFKYNCSALFILKPVVGVNYGTLKEEFGMINSYLRDKAREDLTGELIFVLFRPVDFDYFELFLEEQIKSNSSFLEDYDYTSGYVVLVYKIPDEMKPDFELFKQGKYSKLSDIIRSCYSKEIKTFLKPTPSFQWDVFTKSAKFRKELENFLETRFTKEMELWSIPDIDGKEINGEWVEGKEVLDIQKFLTPESKESMAQNE